MQAALHAMLRRLIIHGRLAVRWPDGRWRAYGDPTRPEVAVSIRSRAAVRRLWLNPSLAVGECYMDGTLELEGCSIYEALDVMICNLALNPRAAPTVRFHTMLRALTRRFDQFNPAHQAWRNVAHHYDLNGRLYSLFLDRDRQYSCAYFARGNETLDEAQAAKKRHIAAKLCLDRPGLTVLDIGCGWGGLALTLARDFGARVTGITLSAEQLAEARTRAAAAGLQDRVRFELMDYRALRLQFDRVVSVGMFEHVGVGHFRAFFDTVGHCLAPDGVALLHAIGRSDGPGATNSWIAKYIFPGGYCPALSEVIPAIEASGLVVADVEILRLHYAGTLRHWRWRFAANRDAIATLYDERFCRMFEFYLAASELAFRHKRQMVFQILMGHDQRAVPLTRDYIQATEVEALARTRSPAMSDQQRD